MRSCYRKRHAEARAWAASPSEAMVIAAEWSGFAGHLTRTVTPLLTRRLNGSGQYGYRPVWRSSLQRRRVAVRANVGRVGRVTAVREMATTAEGLAAAGRSGFSRDRLPFAISGGGGGTTECGGGVTWLAVRVVECLAGAGNNVVGAVVVCVGCVCSFSGAGDEIALGEPL